MFSKPEYRREQLQMHFIIIAASINRAQIDINRRKG